MEEPDEPRRKPTLLVPPVLDRLSVEELRGYIEALRGEIGRVETEIDRKEGVRNAADAVFGFRRET